MVLQQVEFVKHGAFGSRLVNVDDFMLAVPLYPQSPEDASVKHVCHQSISYQQSLQLQVGKAVVPIAEKV